MLTAKQGVCMTDPITLEGLHTSGVYVKRGVTMVRGEGALLWDDQGRQYIDCVGGQGAANLGHANPVVAAAIAAQAQRLISLNEIFPNEQRAAVMERLCQLTNMPRVYLCNSGTESIEAAFKFARATTKRTDIIAAMRGFHGRTMGALSATWNKAYREPFEPLVPGFRHIPYNNLDALSQAVNDKTAAVILEVVQGEGGVHPGTREFLQGAERLCQERGALFILDEVQTGFGRTGKLFAFQHHDLHPDLLCVAKSIAGGVPMGATLISERVGTLPAHIHGSTFGGNPLACAASLAALGEIERLDLPARAAETGAYLIERLSEINSPLIREVRGLGLLVGVELKKKSAPFLQAMMERRVLALSAGMNVIRFLPPLVITREQLDDVVDTLTQVLTQPISEEESLAV
jgi:acetylornithine/LysW-gamma-L-lysine aminotransferase